MSCIAAFRRRARHARARLTAAARTTDPERNRHVRAKRGRISFGENGRYWARPLRSTAPVRPKRMEAREQPDDGQADRRTVSPHRGERRPLPKKGWSGVRLSSRPPHSTALPPSADAQGPLSHAARYSGVASDRRDGSSHLAAPGTFRPRASLGRIAPGLPAAEGTTSRSSTAQGSRADVHRRV